MDDGQPAGIEYSTTASREQRVAWSEAFASSPTTTGGVDAASSWFAVTGHCPRCHHHFSDEGPIGVARWTFPRAFRHDGQLHAPPPRPDEADRPPVTSFTVVCACTAEPPHPGRPASTTGCGAAWAVEDD